VNHTSNVLAKSQLNDEKTVDSGLSRADHAEPLGDEPGSVTA
jgi:hypothetical protein